MSSSNELLNKNATRITAHTCHDMGCIFLENPVEKYTLLSKKTSFLKKT